MTQKKILVIEDTRSIRDEIADILQFEGMEVCSAENGEDGFEQAKVFKPDLILCDIMMPIKNGYEVFNDVQHDPILKNTPFIFLTAKATSDNIRQGMILGADDYITKPFSIDTLIKSINSRLEKEALRAQEETRKREVLQHNISSAIPHELLTPLNGIIGLATMLSDPDTDNSVEQVKAYSAVILESGERLLTTVNQFIYYTEIELLLRDEKKQQSLREKCTDMGILLLDKQCKSIAEKYNRLADLNIELDIFHARILSEHFEIVIANIVDNAFKFSKPGTTVSITVSQDDSFVYISVQDQGIGNFSIEEVDAFIQFDRKKMEQQGLGLGLITALKLIAFYDGRIEFTTSATKGTQIQLALPRYNDVTDP